VDGGAPRIFEQRIGEGEVDEGCVFMVAEGGCCGAPRRPGSSYCREHHALCHLVEGSRGERRRLREAEALASAVGGRQGRPAREPPDPLLRRLENIARGFSRSHRSRIVRRDEG
jgi:hypothetical protein